jgi:bacterioferritin-associated ferredoxin
LILNLIFNFGTLRLCLLSHRAACAFWKLVDFMIVCLCRRVSDRTIRAAIREGAQTEERVAEMCGAGTCCGGCVPTISELIDDERAGERRVSLPVLTEAATLR